MLIAKWQAPCDCGDQPRHWNGGNYHATECVVTVVDGGSEVVAVCLVTGDTSDVFPSDTTTNLWGSACGCVLVTRREALRPHEAVQVLRDCGADHEWPPRFETVPDILEPFASTHRCGEIRALWVRPEE